MDINTIDEAIADAMAEEEIKQEQDKEDNEKQFKEDLRNALRENFSNFMGKKDDKKIMISLEEYLILNNKSKDLDRLIQAIVSDLHINYSKDGLRVGRDDNTVNAFKVLYPEAYADILDDMLKNEVK